MYRDYPKSIIQAWNKNQKEKGKRKAKEDLSQFDKLLQQSVLKISRASFSDEVTESNPILFNLTNLAEFSRSGGVHSVLVVWIISYHLFFFSFHFLNYFSFEYRAFLSNY